jgi:hypothetical protein
MDKIKSGKREEIFMLNASFVSSPVLADCAQVIDTQDLGSKKRW